VTVKSVRIADLKARLSEHLRSVRKGRVITVLDRDTPIAQIVPVQPDGLEIRRATRRPGDVPRPQGPSTATNSLAVLLEDRGRR
jgi:prevent-host-death family protein